MSELIISVRDLTKGYKTKQVLTQLDFGLPRGSVTGLLGKNGAGKTTLIKSILGLIRPQTGEITILGEDVWDLSVETKEKLGYVPQTTFFYSWYKVQEMINYTASFYTHWNSELVGRLLKEWELDPKDRASTLSEGQVQKLSIIMALGHEPELLILDEPVGSLDPAARRGFLKEILDIVADRGCSILFSSHITSDLERAADLVAILDKGHIAYTGALDQLKDEVKRLKISFHHDVPQTLDLPDILRVKSLDKEAIVYIKNYSQDKRRQIQEQWQAEVQVEDINLEEIFVEMTR